MSNFDIEYQNVKVRIAHENLVGEVDKSENEEVLEENDVEYDEDDE